MSFVAERRGCAPPFKATPPARLQRTRRRNVKTPPGAVYVGRPTLWGNPFADRPRIGHARSVILYRSWVAGDLTGPILARAGFDEHEIASLFRWRRRLLARIDELRGRDLQCWCPSTSAWCHADTLLRIANGAPR
ncbi:DUF4326 domain-containing protein [Sphingomonas sp.]|uniref:DUF4326 domain-containing protein n=1 Tax=Sphingomonas sp. TaxID=28214 RepID=UPI003F711913